MERLDTRKKLVFIGPMGSGKSSLARKYIKKYGGRAIDTDAEFTRRYGDITAFFARYGENEFRKREQDLLIEAAESDARVIATGGGAVLSKKGMSALRRRFDIVYLTAPIDKLKARIASSDRPLKNDVEAILKARAPLYEKYADFTVDSTQDSLIALEAALGVPRKNRYDVVLCDADDTVLDFQSAMKQSVLYAARTVGMINSDEHIISVYKSVTDEIWGRLERGEIDRQELNAMRFRLFTERMGVSADADEMNKLYLEKQRTTRFVLYGAKEFLCGMRARGLKVYITTNSYAYIARERLKALDGCADGTFISEELGSDKPNPEFFRKVFEAIGWPDKSRTIVIGDSVTSDIKGGINFGIDTCLYDPSGTKRSDADYTVKRYDQIFDIL